MTKRSAASLQRKYGDKIAKQKEKHSKKVVPRKKILSNNLNLLSKLGIDYGQGMTKEQMMRLINYTINTSAGISSIIETFELLEKEGKVTFSEEQRKVADEFDEASIKFNENAEVISTVLNAGGELEQIPDELIIDTGFKADHLADELAQKFLSLVTDEQRELVDNYNKEHYPNSNYHEIMYKLALERIQRIQPKYATPTTADAEPVNETEE